MNNNKEQLPRIMYDHAQFTPLWLIGPNNIYLSDRFMDEMKKITGYVPEKWMLYTRNQPDPLWFGAYDQHTLDEEARIGFDDFTDDAFSGKFNQAILTMYEKTKHIARIYFKEFYKKEGKMADEKPDEVIDFLRNIQDMNYYILPYHLLTQPQRFYKFEEELKKFLPDKNLEIVSTNGRYLTLISKIHKAMIDLVKKIHDSELSFDNYISEYPDEYKKLEKIVDETGFLNWGILGGEVIDREYIQKEIKEILSDDKKFTEETEKMDILTSAIEKRNEIVKEDASTPVRLADIMGHASVLRLDSQICTLCILKYAENFIKAVQEKHGLSDDQISSYFFDEILNLIKNGEKVEEEILEKRQRGLLRIFTQKDSKTYIAEDAHIQIKDLLEFRKSEKESIKEVIGTIASQPETDRGRISGRVFVLDNIFDTETLLNDFNNGDILIAPQTHPNLVPCMKIASAIVTDEGGVTSHAAIISRELNKICITGTKLGSKIFKTGDKVEINLRNGSVKKIE